MSGFAKIESSAFELKKRLEDGPVVASIRAGNPIFRNYASGVIDSKECTAKSPSLDKDHAVLVIGTGSTRGTSYFIIKNSFSTHWGEKGYARISADTMHSGDGICGILNSMY